MKENSCQNLGKWDLLLLWETWYNFGVPGAGACCFGNGSTKKGTGTNELSRRACKQIEIKFCPISENPQPSMWAQTEAAGLFEYKPPLRKFDGPGDTVTNKSDFQMQASYFPVTAEVVMALNSKYPQGKIHDFINYPTKTLSRNAVLQLSQPLKASHTPPDTQVKRKESLTFQGSSDHKDVRSPRNFKQVQMLPMSSTPCHSLPKKDGFLPSHPCFLCFLYFPCLGKVA